MELKSQPAGWRRELRGALAVLGCKQLNPQQGPGGWAWGRGPSHQGPRGGGEAELQLPPKTPLHPTQQEALFCFCASVSPLTTYFYHPTTLLLWPLPSGENCLRHPFKECPKGGLGPHLSRLSHPTPNSPTPHFSSPRDSRAAPTGWRRAKQAQGRRVATTVD